jgi:hypothetical protein
MLANPKANQLIKALAVANILRWQILLEQIDRPLDQALYEVGIALNYNHGDRLAALLRALLRH